MFLPSSKGSNSTTKIRCYFTDKGS